MKTHIAFLIICLCFTSCVSSKKYALLLDNRNRTEEKRVELEQKLSTAQSALNAHRETLESNEATKQQILDLTSENKKLKNEMASLQMKLEKAEAEIKKSIMDKPKPKKDMTSPAQKKDDPLCEQMEKVIFDRNKSMKQIEAEINTALAGFDSDEINMTKKRGDLYLSLSQNLLYTKGSDQLAAQGRKILAALAPALQKHRNIDVIVKGHTDSDGDVNFNWDLSVRRATAVVKALVSAGLDGHLLTAAGKSIYDPIELNDTSANKAKNRRIEIVISPDKQALTRIMN